MEVEGFSDKENINRHIEAVKYIDLIYLKCVGGPFTTAEEVQRYVDETKHSKKKDERLKVEIQYTKKTTSLRLKNTDPVFRLKQDNKNLYNREYTENLMKYLGFARKAGNIIINDLSDAIKKITDKNLDIQEKSSVVFDNHLPKPGEHVAVLWIEGANEVVWYLCFSS